MMEWLTHSQALEDAKNEAAYFMRQVAHLEGACQAKDKTIAELLQQLCFLNSSASDDLIRNATDAVAEFATSGNKNSFNEWHYAAKMGEFTPALLAEVRRLRSIID